MTQSDRHNKEGPLLSGALAAALHTTAECLGRQIVVEVWTDLVRVSVTQITYKTGT
jgi:hypothetical protein